MPNGIMDKPLTGALPLLLDLKLLLDFLCAAFDATLSSIGSRLGDECGGASEVHLRHCTTKSSARSSAPVAPSVKTGSFFDLVHRNADETVLCKKDEILPDIVLLSRVSSNLPCRPISWMRGYEGADLLPGVWDGLPFGLLHVLEGACEN